MEEIRDLLATKLAEKYLKGWTDCYAYVREVVKKEKDLDIDDIVKVKGDNHGE